ncbi:MAG: hypothetical protein IIA45_15080, partial [Bacteroidetes bacterium]|nr:hypothetical protein [Bacteroidota bacterium]
GSEFTFTPSVVSIQNSSNFMGNTFKDYKYNFNISNLGMVFASVNYNSKGEVISEGLVALNFGFGINKLANFNRTIFYQGANGTSSIADRFLEDAAGNNPGELYSFAEGLAFDTYFLDTIPGETTKYFSPVSNGGVLQTKSIETRGGMYEWVIALGANYSNKLYMGASIGLPVIRYKETSLYNEKDEMDTIPNFKSVTFEEIVETNGQGINLKMGLIYRITDWFRIGGSIQTPTYFSMNDNYYATMETDVDTSFNYTANSPEGRFRYTLITPWRVSAGASLILGKLGFLSADYEFVDHSLSYFSFGDGNIDDKIAAKNINVQINNKYGRANNLRFGAEFKIKKYRVRGGYFVYSSPFQSQLITGSTDDKRTGYSFGLGLRETDYFIDLGYVKSFYGDYNVPYTLNSETTAGAVNKVYGTNIVATVGFKF